MMENKKTCLMSGGVLWPQLLRNAKSVYLSGSQICDWHDLRRYASEACKVGFDPPSTRSWSGHTFRAALSRFLDVEGVSVLVAAPRLHREQRATHLCFHRSPAHTKEDKARRECARLFSSLRMLKVCTALAVSICSTAMPSSRKACAQGRRRVASSLSQSLVTRDPKVCAARMLFQPRAVAEAASRPCRSPGSPAAGARARRAAKTPP